MDKSRNYILDRIMSKKTSIEEFNFDQLQAPPLSLFFTPYDINQLYNIAHSFEYSARPKEKYDAINRICNRRGLVKFGAGTNRVIYRHPEFPDILFKIAMDDVGLGDNPAEFRNQFLLKPFVTKCFEVSPCGTVAIVERVVPITSREEFISVADDIFTLITEWLVGKYVLADIGAKEFQNYGTRKGFGVVLLDYPYLYELDGNKLYCRKQDPNSPTGVCDGIIDYDAGFDHLCCTKCGAVYKAKELEKKIIDKEIIKHDKEGEFKMKIRVSGGTNNTATKVVDTNTGNVSFQPVKESIPVTTNVGDKVDKAVAATATKKISLKNALNDIYNDSAKPVKKEIKKDALAHKAAPVEKKFVNGSEVTATPVAKAEPVVVKKEEPVKAVVKKEEKVVESPFIMSDDIKANAIKKAKPVKSPVQVIDDAVDKIIEALGEIDIDMSRDDAIARAARKILRYLPTDIDSFNMLADSMHQVYSKLDDEDLARTTNNENLVDMISNLTCVRMDCTNTVRYGDNLEVYYNICLMNAYDDDENAYITYSDNPGLTIEGVFAEDTDGEDAAEPEEAQEEVVEEKEPENATTTGAYEGLKFYHATTVNLKDIFPAEDSQNIIVLTDDDGRYLAVDGNIAGAYELDDQMIDSISVVPTKWIEQINSILDDVDKEEEVEVSSAPVGALPVNEFLEKIDKE